MTTIATICSGGGVEARARRCEACGNGPALHPNPAGVRYLYGANGQRRKDIAGRALTEPAPAPDWFQAKYPPRYCARCWTSGRWAEALRRECQEILQTMQRGEETES